MDGWMRIFFLLSEVLKFAGFRVRMRKLWPIEVGGVLLGFRWRQTLIGAAVDGGSGDNGGWKTLLNQNTN